MAVYTKISSKKNK